MDKGCCCDSIVRSTRRELPIRRSYTVTSWHYKRTYNYGSPQLKADGTPGSDVLVPSSAYLSKDGRSVFIGIPGMKPVMQMRVGWTLATAGGTVFQDSASFTPYELDDVQSGGGRLRRDDRRSRHRGLKPRARRRP